MVIFVNFVRILFKMSYVGMTIAIVGALQLIKRVAMVILVNFISILSKRVMLE